VVDSRGPGRRAWILAAAVVLVVTVLTLTRGPVTLVAVAMTALAVALALGLPPLLRPDGVDWDWRPGRASEVRPEPGMATLQRLLTPSFDDKAAHAQLHEIVTSLAADRAPHGIPEGGLLAQYLGAPPRRLSAAEADTIITELEALTTQETP